MANRVSSIVPLLIITLLCVGMVEGGYMVLEYFMSQSLFHKADKQNVPSEEVTKEKQTLEIKHDYRIILQRNLFGPPPGQEKQQSAELPDNQEKTESTIVDVVLMGTVNGNDGTNRAVIMDKKTRKQELYEIGDSVMGNFVKEITRGKVVLSMSGKDETLDMSEAAKMRPAFRNIAGISPAGVEEPAAPVREEAAAPETAESGEMISQGIPPSEQHADTPARRIIRSKIIRPSRSLERQPTEHQ